ncbi:MAG: type IV pilus biogenesis/stability protein PilW [Burkholderiales bacterium]|nr:type IV pilus biogenesis/stability protein PilW [Burkholderiales bacterium]
MRPWRAAAALTLVLAAAGLAGCAAPAGGGAGAANTASGSSSGEGGLPSANTPAPNAADASNADRRARVRLELAALYFGRGQSNTALDELKLAMAANPDMPEVHGLRALIYASLGDAVVAEEAFKRALDLNPRDGDTMHNYGWFLCQQRRYEEAEATFLRATALPNYGEVHRTLLSRGVCQARAGRWAEAERTLSRSYELDPANPVTAYNLSDVLLRRGELERARFYVRRINQVPEAVTAQSLWLAARIERRLGNMEGLRDFGRQLRDRFPQSPETLQYERGRFED